MYGVRSILEEKADWKPLELNCSPLPSTFLQERKQYAVPHTWVTVEVSATIRGLRGASLVILTIFLFNISVLAEQKPDGLERITVDYSTFNQAVKPIMAVFPDMVSVLEQIRTALGTWYEVPGLAIFPIFKEN